MRIFRRQLVAVLAVFAVFPAGAGAYYDVGKSGYDIDVGEVGVGAVYEDAPDAGWLLDRHQSLGPHSVRQGWPITTAAAGMDGLMAKYNGRGLRPLVLATFAARDQPGTQAIPTDAQVASFCRDVSERFGPGGGQMGDANAIEYIELGNETTYDPVARAQGGEYAQRIKTCSQNLRRGVKVLAQGPSDYATYAPDRPEQRWIDDMYTAVPNLNSYRGGWTIHPYGPDDNEMNNLQADLGVRDTAGEYFLTEYGIASDDGRACLGGAGGPTYNNGWPCTISYAQAASGFETTINHWMVTFPRIRALWWYQIADQKDPGQSALRENYYGLFQNAAHGRAKDPLRRKVELYIRDQDDLPADTKPETTLAVGPSGPTNSTSATFAFSSSQGGSSFECRLDLAPFAACSSPKSYGGLSDGLHTFEVRAINLAQNTDPTPASRIFIVDTLAPETAIESGPSGETDDATPTFAFSSSEAGSTFQCRLDAAAFAPCSSPHTTVVLPGGQHTFEVRSTDPAANSDATPATRAFTVRTTQPPELPPTLQPQPPTPTLALGALSLGNLTLSPSRFRAATKQTPIGARIYYTVNRAANVKFIVTRSSRGVRRGKACLTPPKSSSKKTTSRRCTRTIIIASFTRASIAGDNSFRLTASVNSRALSPGSYKLTASATDTTGKTSATTSKSFTIVR